MDGGELQALEDFIVDDDLERLEDLVAEFNIFKVLGIQTRETRHSAFLAWLLDPDGSHRLGDYFLRRFLSRVTGYARATGMSKIRSFDVDGWRFDDVVVDVERYEIDILIRSDLDKFVCVIENKILSAEHSGQLKKYRQTVEKEYPGLTPLFVLLSPDGVTAINEEDAANYVPFSYVEIADLIERVLRTRSSILGNNVRTALEQYLVSLRRYVLSESEVQKLAREIYSNHKQAIDLIIEARPDVQQELWDVVREVMKDSNELRHDFSNKSTIRYYDPRWDLHPELKLGEAWTSSNRMLLVEFKNNRASLGLHLILGPGPEETRQRVYDESVSSRRTKVSKKLTGSWTDLYSRPILRASDYEDPNLDAMRGKIEKALKEFLTQDLDDIADMVDSALGE